LDKFKELSWLINERLFSEVNALLFGQLKRQT